MAWKAKIAGNLFFLSCVTGMGYLPHFPSPAWAGESPYSYNNFSYNNFGGIGLLDMRTARFAPDGTIAVGTQYNSRSTRFFSTWQATPWLETTLSYSDDRSDHLGSDHLGVDRSLDVKIRLWREGNYRPQLAVGVQDALGSGRYGAEYIVASKRYYDVDFTMGFAWGYLGSRGGLGNMFRLFGDNFDQRSTTTSSGGIRTGSYFSGDKMSFFAGAEYHPPIRGLSLKVEYSGVDTRKIVDFAHLKRKMAFNFGLNYKPASWADIAVGFDYGQRLGIRLTLKQNIHKLKFRKYFENSDPPPILKRPKPVITEDMLPMISASIAGNDQLFDRLRRLGTRVIEIEQQPEEIIITVRSDGEYDGNHLTLLGAILEYHDRATLYIRDKKQNIEKFSADRTDTIGRAALESFRSSAVYSREQADDKAAKYKTVRAAYNALEQENLSPVSIVMEKHKAVVRKITGPFHSEARNIGRTARVLTRQMPDHIEEFSIQSEEDGIEISHISLLRKDLERASDYQSSPEEIWANSIIRAPGEVAAQGSKDNIIYHPGRNGTYNWGFKPEILSHFGGNGGGRFRVDLYAKLFGRVQVTQNLILSAELKQYIVGDIDKIPRDMRPDIPKVRSDISRYSAEGRTALERMQFDYSLQLGRDLYARASGGLLESMYGGLGAEVLYRPYHNDFAFGLNLNWVKQRGFSQLFSFRDYQVVTGHATFYHENTTYNITSKLSAGRYLAGDYGATLDVSRRLSNGIRIGVWATVTDMSSEEFGEGSFDKGIYLTMPLEIFWYQPSREKIRFNFRSLGKNGGQMLDRRHDLYDMLSAGRKSRLAYDWREILD